MGLGFPTPTRKWGDLQPASSLWQALGDCSHAFCRVVQRWFKHHYSRNPCIFISASPLCHCNLWKCLSIRKWSAYHHTVSKWFRRLILCIHSHSLFFSISFQSALFYPRAALWVCGIPGSFVLPFDSSVGSILPFKAWLCFPSCRSREQMRK